jgi:hypothetical protein
MKTPGNWRKSALLGIGILVSAACASPLWDAPAFADGSPKEEITTRRVAESSFCLSCLKFTVGPAERVLGPTCCAVDNQFSAIASAGELFGYTANAYTYLMRGPDLEHLSFVATPVLGPGPLGTYDECGAWLEAVDQSPGVVRAWYHAERGCNYTNNGQTHMSAGYAESYDGGQTFTKPGYPNNRILSNADVSQDGTITGEGNINVIKWNGYYYGYFLETSVWRTGVARSAMADGGKPGTWWKWYNGAFSQPGLGGLVSPIGFLGDTFTVTWNPLWSRLVASGIDAGLGGFKLSFSSDAVNWTSLAEPLIYSPEYDWSRATLGQLVSYPSIVLATGGTEWTEGFYLFYLYLQPGSGFTDRYLVRRWVDVETHPNTVSPQVRVALSRYYSAAQQESWATTVMVPDDYGFQTTLGHVYTKSRRGMRKLVDCYRPADGDHFLSTATTCEGDQTLRVLGWVWSRPTAGTTPLYRCVRWGSAERLVSTDSACEGLGATEAVLGYVEP